jgi:hypothetical protein
VATVESEFVVDFSAKSAGGANFLTKSTDGNRPDYKIRTQKDSTIFVNFLTLLLLCKSGQVGSIAVRHSH